MIWRKIGGERDRRLMKKWRVRANGEPNSPSPGERVCSQVSHRRREIEFFFLFSV